MNEPTVPGTPRMQLPTPALRPPHLVELGVPGPVGLVPKARGLVHWRGLIDPPVQSVKKRQQLLNGLWGQRVCPAHVTESSTHWPSLLSSSSQLPWEVAQSRTCARG